MTTKLEIVQVASKWKFWKSFVNVRRLATVIKSVKKKISTGINQNVHFQTILTLSRL